MKCKAWLLLLAGLFLYSTLAFASQHCAVSASPLSFPPYDMFDGIPVQSQTEIIVNCEPDLPYVVKIGPGQNAQGDFARRQMLSSDGTRPLLYNLFLDTSYNRIWGDGTGFSEFYTGAGLGRPEVLRVFGRVPPSQNVSPGIYADSLIITVEW